MLKIDGKGKRSMFRLKLFVIQVFINVKLLIKICFFIVAERPQHMLMRVAVGIHKRDIEAAIETYNLLSEKWFTHASPTLFNAGTNKPQLSR